MESHMQDLEFSLVEPHTIIKLGGVANTPECCLALQKDHMLERWAEKNFLKLNKGKCRVLHLRNNNPRHQYRPCLILGSSESRRLGDPGAGPAQAMKMKMEHLSYKDRLRELGLYRLKEMTERRPH
ncbi:hypothetical protein WISP_122264 [Willisornis vidua]|uniref:Rna-directed dna polymerase from mobile element jockey-like n=1 Tax=Willisornis vidua TaxID=1566151 RepID=A0ABQ9CY16_9PASS|nr:hypothetical protein WISP_122264 [Willisornis vidua]